MYDFADNSSFQGILRGLSDFLSIFKNMTAFVLALAFIPLTYMAYKYVSYKGDELKNIILEIETLPVNEQILKNLKYAGDNNSSYINKKKIFDMFYESNSHNRIKLKHHLNLKTFLQDNMQKYIIKPIYLEDEKGNLLFGEEIFGLFPCGSHYFSLGHREVAISRGAISPAVLIIPSKKNRKELLAMQKFDAFFFSNSYDETSSLQDNIDKYIKQDDPFKKMEQSRKAQRRTIQFSLEQALKSAISEHPGLIEIERGIDPLMPSIIELGGTGTLTRDDVDFAKKFKDKFRDNIFYKSIVPAAPFLEHKKSRSDSISTPTSS
jgi:hypothetical protein